MPKWLRLPKLAGLPNYWQQFFVCLTLHFALPLFPLLVEHLVTGSIAPVTIATASSVYVLAIGTSSRNVLLFVLSIALTIGYMVLLAMWERTPQAVPAAGADTHGAHFVWWSLGFFVVFNLGERYNRHIMERAPYLEFLNAREVGV